MKKPAPTSNPAPRQNANPTPSIIGSDVEIEGNVRTVGELQLDGAIHGDLTCGGLVMGESGAVKGSISADNVTIRGKVNGEIRARSVRLEKSAVVDGDVYHESLSVEAGAKLTGRFAHTSSPKEAKVAAAVAPTDETPSFVAKKPAAE
ncbi:bactofilin family protein [Kordiimonas gwangyangensis]|uniref:bactofilin family protein n=1 Tax=Kordiimonas gwangyangensis TaxID=288022 RepID=UPI00037A6468|nr:polymer-forming cytoskeletal protein [Kordiimonas gwangyangensis]